MIAVTLSGMKAIESRQKLQKANEDSRHVRNSVP